MQDICGLLNIRYPIIQGAMGHVTNGTMAAAVTNAGGLGTIASADKPLEFIQTEYRLAKRLTKGTVALNIPFKNSLSADISRFVLEDHVDVVVASAGSPKAFLADWKREGIRVISVVATVEHAKKMSDAGVDVIVAEGMESGGKIGYMTTMTLVPQVADAVSVPVVAAGGIADGRGIAAAFQLGACGVQIGTRFLFAKECPIHENFRQAILKAKSSDVVITGRPYSYRGEARILRNELFKKFIEMEKSGAADEDYKPLFDKSMPRALVEGDVENGSPMVGQIVGMLDRIQSAEEIIQELVRDYNAQPALPKIL